MTFNVFWLPDRLLVFDWARSVYPAGGDEWRDEKRIACFDGKSGGPGAGDSVGCGVF